jgi:hypothetical protein
MNINDIIQILDDTTKELSATLKKKSSDYTGGEKSVDPFANFRATEVLGVDPVIGIMMRIMDKIQRIRSFVNDGRLKVSNESVYDAFDDIIGYTILAKAMMIQKRQEGGAEKI